MARLAKVLRDLKEPKFKTRKKSRCRLCGRTHAYMQRFALCRICFRELASKGLIPGVRKSSW